MAGSEDRVRLDIGFKGGATLTVAVTVPEADTLEQRLLQGDGGVVDLQADDGRLLIALGHVLYVRRHARGSRVGFSAAT